MKTRARLAGLLGRMETASPARLRADRATDALEHLGTPAATAHLEALSRGTPECLWTIQAQEALARMSGR